MAAPVGPRENVRLGRRVGRATIRDVAIAANVDTSTVSKVLSGAAISVRDETRARIHAEAERLNYRPSATARSLRSARTGAFGMLVPDFTNPVYAEIVRGAVREAESRGRVMLLAELDPSHSADAYIRLVEEQRIDGLLVATARSESPILSLLEKNDEIPHIFLNRRGSASSVSVVNNDERGAALGARTLIEAGHTRLAVINGPSDVDTAQRRLAGFARACKEAGLPEPAVVSAAFSARGGHEAAKEILNLPGSLPTGLFASNLTMALGALAGFAQAGVRIPQELSIVAFDDGELAAVAQPPLTAIAMPHEEMGATAVSLLESMLDGQAVTSTVVSTPPVLVPRESVAPPPAVA